MAGGRLSDSGEALCGKVTTEAKCRVFRKSGRVGKERQQEVLGVSLGLRPEGIDTAEHRLWLHSALTVTGPLQTENREVTRSHRGDSTHTGRLHPSYFPQTLEQASTRYGAQPGHAGAQSKHEYLVHQPESHFVQCLSCDTLSHEFTS